MKSLLLLLLLVPCASAQSLVDRTDNQQWTDVQLAVPVTKNFDFNLLGTLRLGRDISRPVDERVGAGFTWRIGKYWTVSPNVLGIGMQPVRGRKIWETRLSLPVTLRFNVGKFRLSDRNLFEHRIRNSGLRANRYRNRFAAGATKVFNKHYTQDFYYLRQNDGVSVPGDLNVIGTTLRFRL